jgi:hypothetical protein
MTTDRGPREAMARVAELQANLAEALDVGDLGAWEELARELRLAERDRDRAIERAVARVHKERGTYRSALPAPTSREQTHALLNAVGVPISPQLIISLAGALYGEELSYKAVTSLRHDERRAHIKAPGTRSYYICPALQHDTFAPVRGLLTVSSWDLADRLIGPLTPRTTHLRLTIHLAESLDRAGDGDADPTANAVAIERLLWRLSATVPGVRRSELDPGRIHEAADRELAVLVNQDAADRATAARRAVHLPEAQRLFGASLKAAPADETTTGGAR